MECETRSVNPAAFWASGATLLLSRGQAKSLPIDFLSAVSQAGRVDSKILSTVVVDAVHP
jgi:hypothetical protein